MKKQLGTRNALWLALNAGSLLALSLIMFRKQAPVTFFRYDGTFILSVVKNQAEWMTGFGSFTMDFLKGIGGLWFPIDTRLMPGFFIGGAAGFGSNWFPALSMTWFAFEFAVAVILVGRVIGARLPATILATWLGLFGALPYLLPTPAMERTWGNPHMLPFMALSMIVIILFIEIGRGSRTRSILCVSAIFLILTYLTVVTPLSAVLFLPVIAFFGTVALTMAVDRRELNSKLVSALVIAIGYAALFALWLSGLFLNAKTTFFWSDLYPTPVTWHSISLLLEDPSVRPAGVVFYCAALVGGLLIALRSKGAQRRFAIGYLCFVGLLWICAAIMIALGREWSGPQISYLDWMIYPLHALFAAEFVYLCLKGMWFGRSRAVLPSLLMFAAAFVPWMALVVWTPLAAKPIWYNHISFRWPPRPTPIVGFLQNQIEIQPGKPFRGRVVNLAGTRFRPQFATAPFLSQHDYDAMVALATGNDHREYGLWYYDIPTLDDTNHVSSPFFHLLMGHLLNNTEAKLFRPHETATLFKPELLAQLGVRYVITDSPIPTRDPVVELPIPGAREQYVYELQNANVSGRGVSRVEVVHTAAEALSRMRSPDMNFREKAVLFDAIPEAPLVPVSRSRLDVYPGFLRVSARAPGRALLVLPVEFSRCLEFTWDNPGANAPRALRANLDQTAILFEGEIEGRLALRTGPFVNPGCRLRDFQDAVAVQLGSAR